MVLLLVLVLVVLVPTTYYSVFHGSPLRIDFVPVGHPSTLDHIIQHLRVEARFVVHTRRALVNGLWRWGPWLSWRWSGLMLTLTCSRNQ